jgi:uncharacterized Zn finger protein (UPF0148 family)
MSDTILCPACGWTGSEDELVREDGDTQCPVCAEVIG